MTTGWLWDERYAHHDTRAWSLPWVQPIENAENGETKRRFANLVALSGLERKLHRLEPRPATVAEIERVHDAAYVEWVLRVTESGWGDIGDGETPYGPGSGQIALLAAGGAISVVDAVLDGAVSNAYALVRPPGHHAHPSGGMGYCLFNNIAVAVRHAQEKRGLRRIAIVDWDVHHGNGTETVFYEDPSVLTISLHEAENYPEGRGRRVDNGAGPGQGANVNVPLPSGSGRGAYVAAMERVVVPALERFRPELVVVASGLDAGAMDAQGRQALTSESYRILTRQLLATVDRLCSGRLVVIHEGGYDPLLSPFCGLAVLETLAGEQTEVVDPWSPSFERLPEQELLPHHAEAVDAAAALVASVPAHAA